MSVTHTGPRGERSSQRTGCLSRLRAAKVCLLPPGCHPERIKVVDASRSPEEIHKEIVALVEPLL